MFRHWWHDWAPKQTRSSRRSHGKGRLRLEGNIQFFAIVNHASGCEVGAVAELGGRIVGEGIEAHAELRASPPDIMAFGSVMERHGKREAAVPGKGAAVFEFQGVGPCDQRIDVEPLAE